jgi:hypothetical protein
MDTSQEWQKMAEERPAVAAAVIILVLLIALTSNFRGRDQVDAEAERVPHGSIKRALTPGRLTAEFKRTILDACVELQPRHPQDHDRFVYNRLEGVDGGNGNTKEKKRKKGGRRRGGNGGTAAPLPGEAGFYKRTVLPDIRGRVPRLEPEHQRRSLSALTPLGISLETKPPCYAPPHPDATHKHDQTLAVYPFDDLFDNDLHLTRVVHHFLGDDPHNYHLIPDPDHKNRSIVTSVRFPGQPEQPQTTHYHDQTKWLGRPLLNRHYHNLQDWLVHTVHPDGRTLVALQNSDRYYCQPRFDDENKLLQNLPHLPAGTLAENPERNTFLRVIYDMRVIIEHIGPRNSLGGRERHHDRHAVTVVMQISLLICILRLAGANNSHTEQPMQWSSTHLQSFYAFRDLFIATQRRLITVFGLSGADISRLCRWGGNGTLHVCLLKAVQRKAERFFASLLGLSVTEVDATV